MDTEPSCEFAAAPTCGSTVLDLIDLLVTQFLLKPTVVITIGLCWVHAATTFDSGRLKAAVPECVIT